MAVLDKDAAKEHLNITGSTHDTQITAIIAAAEAAIAERVGPLEPVARTVRVRPSGSCLLVPSPAAALTTVTDSNGTAIDTASLFLEQRSGIITQNDGSSFSASWYTVVYQHGRTPCPADLVLAVKEMVRHLWTTQRGPSKRPGSTDSDATSNTIPGAAYLLPFRVSELIAPYRPALVAG